MMHVVFMCILCVSAQRVVWLCALCASLFPSPLSSLSQFSLLYFVVCCPAEGCPDISSAFGVRI